MFLDLGRALICFRLLHCLFADRAGEVFEILAQDCDLHTVLRLPRGTFTPYSPGTKTNAVLFTKGYPTEHVWIYDARSNVPPITKKDRPLTPAHFANFERCYGPDPNARAPPAPPPTHRTIARAASTSARSKPATSSSTASSGSATNPSTPPTASPSPRS